NTARLSGRVAQYLRGTLIAEPGGDFRPARPINRATGDTGTPDPAVSKDSTPEPSTTDPNSQASVTAVANVIQTIQDLTELLDELGSERSEEHTSELQSRFDLVCRLLLEKKNNHIENSS